MAVFRRYTKCELDENLNYLITGDAPLSMLGNRAVSEAFKRRAKPFRINSSGGLAISHPLLDTEIKIFGSDEQRLKLQALKDLHGEGHPGRIRLLIAARDHIYGVTREDVEAVISHCTECQVSRLMTTKSEIKPIIARYPRDRYIADLIDLHYYHDINDGFHVC